MPKKMNLTSKLHQKFVYEKIKETNWSQGSNSPLIIELDTTEACDLACPGCISEDIMKTKNRFSNERLLELGREFYNSGIKGVVLIGGGEPLAHPAISQFINYLGENDIHVGITTNGTLIHKHLEPIAKYASWTRVSVDAASAETFGILRPSKGGGSRFDHIIENMRKLAKIKQGKLGYSFLIQTPSDGNGVISNIHEIYSAAKLAKEIGCDYFEIKPSYQFRNGIDHALMVHDKQLMQQAIQQISRLDDLSSNNFSIIKAINLDFSLAGKQSLQEKEYTNCPVAELRTLVCPSGAFVCPYWRGKEKMRIGDLNQSTFFDMWNSKQRKQVMKSLNPSKDCTFHCLRHDSNLEVLKMRNMIGEKREIMETPEFDRFI